MKNESKKGLTIMKNEMEIVFDAVSANESLARVAAAAFISPLNPTLEEISDIKTAVSEAVTNAIIHGYENYEGYEKSKNCCNRETPCNPGKVRIYCVQEGYTLHIEVSDTGKGIENIDRAMEPLFTSKPELERSGMGFSFMEAYVDELEVESKPMQGTTVRLTKKINTRSRNHRSEESH